MRALPLLALLAGPVLLGPVLLGPVLLGPVLAGPAAAQEALDADAFEALVEGRTLAYGAEGAEVPRGVETYAPGRRVTWLEVATGICREGRWYGREGSEPPEICFVYEGDPGPHCFVHVLQGDVVITTDPDGSDREVSRLDLDRDGIACAWLGS